MKKHTFTKSKVYFKDCELSSSEPENQGDHDNMQCQKSLAKRILEFCKYLPLWCAVMVPIFNVGEALTGSSAASESRFYDIKNRVLQHKKLPIRIDDFQETHINSILGETNMCATRFQRSPSTFLHSNVPTVECNKNISEEDDEATLRTKDGKGNPNDQHIEDIDTCQPVDITEKETDSTLEIGLDDDMKLSCKTTEENWRGLATETNKPLKKRKPATQCTYLSEDPSITYMNKDAKKVHQPIGVLCNGNITKLRSIEIEQR